MYSPKPTHPLITLRLITDIDNIIDGHCSLCPSPPQTQQQEEMDCYHSIKRHSPNFKRHSPFSSTFSDSFYTAAQTPGNALANITLFPSATSSTTSLARNQRLRRRTSPTEMSLRELREKHAWQSTLRMQRSEEALQRVYESQVLTYLDGTFASLDSINE